MLSSLLLQTKTRHNTDDQVYWKGDKDDKGKPTRKRYWICCVKREKDGTVKYRLKTSPTGALGGWVKESQLRKLDWI